MHSYNDTIEGEAPHIHRGTVLRQMGTLTQVPNRGRGDYLYPQDAPEQETQG